MKKLAFGLVAAGALVAATAVPALAQVGIYAGPGGFSVELGAPGYYYGGPAPYYSGYYDYAPGWDGGSPPERALRWRRQARLRRRDGTDTISTAIMTDDRQR
jgi:hypothetical protein